MSCGVLQGQWTALHYAAEYGHAPVVQLLYKAGAALDAKSAVS